MITLQLMKAKSGMLCQTGRTKFLPILIFMIMFTTSLFAQSVDVRGVVTDATGETIPGVNVLEKGTTNGTVSNIDGEFALTVSNSNAILVVSFVGYTTLEEPVGNRTTIEIRLEEDTKSLDEVVVVGYGTQRKSDLTGAISSIKSEEITRLPVADVTQSLQGRVSGVQVTSNSGQPGEGTTIRVRGVGTLNNANPLFVVDGMLLDNIDFINPNDVESMEVLKDASATAIYGSRGANGVIIVTTRQGGYGEKTQFTVDAYTGIQNLERRIDLVNANQFAQLANELEQNVGNDPIFEPNQYGVGTNWQDEIFRTAPVNSVNLGARGGTERTSFNLSVNYFNQSGIVKESEFERLTFRLNNQYKANDALTFGHNISFIYTNRQNAPDVISSAYRAYPIFTPRNPDGSFTDISPVGNPAASFEYNSNNQFNNYRTTGNFFADLKFLKNFTFRSNLGFDFGFGDDRNFTPVFFVSPLQQNLENVVSVNNNRTRNILFENTVTYENEWGDHRLNVLGGITSQSFYSESIGGTRRNLPGNDPVLWYLNAGELTTQTNSNMATDWAMVSYLFRANYVFRDKFLFTGTIRRDGSSRFGQENRFGNFPSLAVGYRIIEEPFMQNQTIFSELKFRASWGRIGNDKIGEYQGVPVITGNQNAVFGQAESLLFGATITQLANPFIRWEETEQTDIGFEFGMFDNRLYGEIDYYYRRTNDILVGVPIPAYVGSTNNPIVNAASVENAGFDISVNWRDRIGDFGYNFGIIASTVNNKVLDIGQGNEALFGGAVGISGLLGSRTIVGESIGHYFGYQTAGVFQNQGQIDSSPIRGPEVPGDLIFVDTNNDGVVNSNDRVILGSPIPKLIYGWNIGFNYKAFDFRADFNGTYGNEIYNSKKQQRFNTYNFETSYLDRWTGPGTSNSEPRVTNGGHNYEVSDRFIEDGSFMRLRNIQVGYTLSNAMVERIRMQNVRVFVSGTNVYTWTNYNGYTPEIGGGDILGTGFDSGLYPLPRTFNVGVSANF